MKKLTAKVLGIFLGIVLATTICTNIASAHSSQSSTQQGCGHLIVYLHGTSPTTSKCMDASQSSQHAIPYTSVSDCGPSSLHLYNNANFDASNGDVCFIGTGFINLTDLVVELS